MKLSEIKIGQTVYHPIHGEGYITFIDADGKTGKPRIRVKFPNPKGALHHHESFFETDRHGVNSISHLHPYPVTVVPTNELEVYKQEAEETAKIWRESLHAKLLFYQKLVKAQNDLILFLQFIMPNIDHDNMMKWCDIKDKINQLESLLNK